MRPRYRLLALVVTTCAAVAVTAQLSKTEPPVQPLPSTRYLDHPPQYFARHRPLRKLPS